MSDRHTYIDRLLELDIGGIYSERNEWIPVYELSDPELVILYDLVLDEQETKNIILSHEGWLCASS